MNKTIIAELENTLNSMAKELPKVTGKKMFGCHAVWANGNVFALIWKTGRIGVKLPEADLYEKLLSKPGAEPWKAGAMTMSHWVLVPEDFHTKKKDLHVWVVKAHLLALNALPKATRGKLNKNKK